MQSCGSNGSGIDEILARNKSLKTKPMNLQSSFNLLSALRRFEVWIIFQQKAQLPRESLRLGFSNQLTTRKDSCGSGVSELIKQKKGAEAPFSYHRICI